MTEVAPSLFFISSLEHHLDIGSVEDDVETSFKCYDVWIKFCFNDMLAVGVLHCDLVLPSSSRRLKGVAKQSLSGYRHFPANFPQLVIGWQKVF